MVEILRLYEEALGSHLKMDHLGCRQTKIAGFICNKSTIIKYPAILGQDRTSNDRH
jgi:hypothetical protein